MSLKIGIPAQDQPEYKFGVNKSYLDWIYQFGHPIVLLPAPKEEFMNIYKLDALILPGGADVNPQRYTIFPQISTGNSNIYLEYFDTDILPLLIGNIPIFGICRGLQTLNVYFKGTLKNLWRHPFSSYDDLTSTAHKIIESTNVKGGKKFDVNSFHHQAIKNIGNNLKSEMISTGTNEDVIEAISNMQKKIFAVQWHPERLHDEYSISKFQEILR